MMASLRTQSASCNALLRTHLQKGARTLCGAAGAGGQGASPYKKSNLYTRTGDDGTSQLFTGERISKSDATFEALGNTDELNAHIGVAIAHCSSTSNGLESRLEQIQSMLLDVGSAVATPLSSASERKQQRAKFDADTALAHLEAWTDELDSKVPPLKNFILPSGGLSSAQIHVSRAVCRRAERSIVPLVSRGNVDPKVQNFLNRLSDFLFAAARFAAAHDGHPETVYKKMDEKR